MNGKAKVSNFIKLPLINFLESSGTKFDTAIEKVFILQLERESEAENEGRKRRINNTMFEEERK